MIDFELIDQTYDVVLGESTWDQVLLRLRHQFSADTAVLIAYGDRTGAADCRCLSGHDESVWRAYQTHYAGIDPYAAAMRSGDFPAGRVMAGDDVVPAKTLTAGAFYDEWFRRYDLRYTAGAHVRSYTGKQIMLGVPRSQQAGAYGPDELRGLQVHFNHIRRALEMQDELNARSGVPDFDRIAVRYGLTAAEATLVQLLAETGSLKASATRAGRSYYTARAQLRTVFQKTSTRSQVQLMGLIHQREAAG